MPNLPTVVLLGLLVGACAARPAIVFTPQYQCSDGSFGHCSMIDNKLLRTL